MSLWSVPVPAAFWDWARWMISGRKGPRPRSVEMWLHLHGRRKIPADWYTHLAVIRVRPRPKAPAPLRFDLGIAGTGNGVMFVHPGGDAEIAPDLVANGFTYALFNIGDYKPSDWQTSIRQAQNSGLMFGPWARLDPLQQGTGLEMAAYVEAIADVWSSPISGHNDEKEAETTTTPADLAKVLSARGKRTRVIPMEGWPQDIDWSPLGDLDGVIGGPETFLNVRADLHPKVCVDHSVAVGYRAALPIFGAGPMAEGPVPVPPDEYFSQWPGLFLVYPGNGLNAREWNRHA